MPITLSKDRKSPLGDPLIVLSSRYSGDRLGLVVGAVCHHDAGGRLVAVSCSAHVFYDPARDNGPFPQEAFQGVPLFGSRSDALEHIRKAVELHRLKEIPTPPVYSAAFPIDG